MREIAVVAGFTTEEGPSDDWFVALVRTGCRLYDFPVTADGTVVVLTELGVLLGVPLGLDLVSSTDLRSRIMYPAHMAEEPLFRYRRILPAGVIEVLWKLLGEYRIESKLTRQVQDWVNGLGTTHCE